MSFHRLTATPSGRTIVWISEDGDYVDVVERGGQAGITVVMDTVCATFTTENGRVVPDLHEPAHGLSIDTDVRGGYPVLAGIRLPYDAVAGLARDGLTDAEIIAIYPTATPHGIAGARDFANLVHRATEAA